MIMRNTKLSYQMVLNCMEMQLYVIMQEFMALIYLITLLYNAEIGPGSEISVVVTGYIERDAVIKTKV